MLDATAGDVKLITAAPGGKLQSGDFTRGAFTVRQERSGVTDLQLAGGRTQQKACGASGSVASGRGASGSGASGHPATGSAAAVARGVLRLLHGHAHGRFRTVGRFAAATVRGTEWTTTDRCDGTAIAAQTGTVATKTSKTPLNFNVTRGQSVIYRCVFPAASPTSRLYCLALLTTDRIDVIDGHQVRIVNFGAGLATIDTSDTYQLCSQPPAPAATPSGCAQFPFGPPDNQGFRSAGIGCVPSQAGDYLISWQLDGVQLGSLTYHAPAASPVLVPCSAFVGPDKPGPRQASLGQDSVAVNQYVVPSDGSLSDIGVYLGPTGNPGQQLIKGVVYADDNGQPGQLLGTTDELVFHATDPAKLYQLDFANSPSISAGKVWIGLISGAEGNVAAYRYDSGTPRALTNSSYATGPPDPFGPTLSTDDERMSLYLDYDVG